MPRTPGTRGAALILALLALALLGTVGLGLVLNTSAETIVTGNFQYSEDALYASDAGIDRAFLDLVANGDWTAMLRGAGTSPFIDGSPGGARMLPDGSSLDLTAATNLLNCGHPQACSPGEMDASTPERPWGVNNPRWRLWIYAPLERLTGISTNGARTYVVVWIGDDQAENDNDPTVDGAGGDNPGRDLVVLHAEAYGVQGARRVVEATVSRKSAPGDDEAPDTHGRVRILSWRTIRAG